LALHAEEGRGIATIREREPRAGTDLSISEWGNPTTVCGDRDSVAEGTGGIETSQYPEEQKVSP
jgi:hypothetical protein